MRHIAIDPSMLGAKKPKPCYAFDGTFVRKIFIDQIGDVNTQMCLSMCASIDTVIIEGGFTRFYKQADGLAHARRRLCDAALREGMRVFFLPVTTWQAGMLGKKRKGICKERSCMVASDIMTELNGTPTTITDDNEADAICIWEYSRRNPDLFTGKGES